MERKSSQLMERVISTEAAALISVCEGQLVKLEEQKIALSEKIKACGRPMGSFEETFRTALGFLANPWKPW